MTFLKTIFKNIEPNNIEQDWNHSNLQERSKWRLVIKEELTSMIQNNVLSQLSKRDEHKVSRPLEMRWFINIK